MIAHTFRKKHLVAGEIHFRNWLAYIEFIQLLSNGMQMMPPRI